MHSKMHGYVRTLATVGVLVALAVVIRNFSIMLPIAGVSALRVSFAEVFTRIAAILFGPFYGGISSGALDIMGFLLAGGAYGPYIPAITVNAVFGGILTGLLWMLAGRINFSRARSMYLIILAVIGIIGGLFQASLSFLPGSALTNWLLQLKNKDGISIFPVIPVVLIIIAAIGALLFIVNAFLKKSNGRLRINDDFLRVLFAIGFPGLIVSSLDSAALAVTYGAPFMVFWIPRISQQALMIIVHAYMATYLLAVYRKFRTKAVT